MRKATMRWNRHLRIFSACLLLALCLMSCSTHQVKPDVIEQHRQIQKVDSTDPLSVAHAFFTAIAEKDVDAALEHVVPAQRPSFEKEFEKGLPSVPTAFELEVESITEKETAQIQMVNGDMGLDLRYTDDRWWIVM